MHMSLSNKRRNRRTGSMNYRTRLPHLSTPLERKPVTAPLTLLQLIIQRSVVLSADRLFVQSASLGVCGEKPEEAPEEDLEDLHVGETLSQNEGNTQREERPRTHPTDHVSNTCVGLPHLDDLRGPDRSVSIVRSEEGRGRTSEKYRPPFLWLDGHNPSHSPSCQL